jgi:gamma-glutamylaminecyclotransferase
LRSVASVRLFVYGSLKRGGLHHDELGGAPFLGEAQTEPGYVLTQLGSYWALLPAPESSAVVSGELFEVAAPRLTALDDFEGDAYARGTVRLSAAHSRGFREALAYFKKSG